MHRHLLHCIIMILNVSLMFTTLCATFQQQAAEQQSSLTQSAYANGYTASAVAAAAVAPPRTAAGAFAFLDNYGDITTATLPTVASDRQSVDAYTTATSANTTKTATVSEWSRVSVAVLNPKAITVGELYGHFSALTQEVIPIKIVHDS
jgi:uncharacterized iron-regulated protein